MLLVLSGDSGGIGVVHFQSTTQCLYPVVFIFGV